MEGNTEGTAFSGGCVFEVLEGYGSSAPSCISRKDGVGRFLPEVHALVELQELVQGENKASGKGVEKIAFERSGSFFFLSLLLLLLLCLNKFVLTLM